MSVWSNLSDSSFLEVFDSVLSKCDASYCCCGCCAALRPRYKRLVDNIFPVNPEDGLVRSNMDKLTFYSMSSPEKLDRIGEYLAQRVSRDIYRHRNSMVVIAMEAMDQLLLACHAQSLNLFVESFLKTVQKLLETTDPQLQVLASQSFVKFANIEEDTPSYHRRYDFFVSKFASLCHSSHAEIDVMNSLRVAGLRGIQGVVRKTVSDDLVENIWEPTHMDKIVPSLLYNMQSARINKFLDSETNPSGHPEADAETNGRNIDPASLAENCLRELVGKASYGNIRSVIKPVFKHLDLHDLWVPNDFAIYTFRVIMFSIQVQYSYTVVENLMKHMENSNRSKAIVRTSMANVLSKIISIAAGESVGPSVLEIVDCLVKQLKESVLQEKPGESSLTIADEKLFQDALISALAEFAYHLPDYQKIEIMMFILGRAPGLASEASQEIKPGETFIQHMLLKCLLKVGTKYRTTNYSTALRLNFLEPLLRASLSKDSDVRILVQEILQCMLDRHENRSKLKIPSVEIVGMNLALEKCSRADAMFYKNHGSRILMNLSESLEMNHLTRDNIESVYCTAALICIELPTDDMLVDAIRWALAVQDVALTSTMLDSSKRSLLHVVAISIIVLAAHTTNLSQLMEYALQVISARSNHAPFLLDANARSKHHDDNIQSACLLDYNTISDCVKEAGKDVGMMPIQGQFNANQRHSWADSSIHQPSSSNDLNNMFHEGGDSNASSPGLPRRHIEEEVTFEALKKVLAESAESRREAEFEKRQMICEKFQNTPFQKLVESSQSKGDILSDTLNQILTNISVLPCQPEGNSSQSNQSLPLYGPCSCTSFDQEGHAARHSRLASPSPSLQSDRCRDETFNAIECTLWQALHQDSSSSEEAGTGELKSNVKAKEMSFEKSAVRSPARSGLFTPGKNNPARRSLFNSPVTPSPTLGSSAKSAPTTSSAIGPSVEGKALSRATCELAIEAMKASADHLLILQRRLAGGNGSESDSESNLSDRERADLLQLLSSAATPIIQSLKSLQFPPAGIEMDRAVMVASPQPSENNPLMVQMMQQYSDMLLSMIQQRMGVPAPGSPR